jgi:hypothetical protein
LAGRLARLAQSVPRFVPIIGQLRDAERNVEPGEIQELEALIWKKRPNP